MYMPGKLTVRPKIGLSNTCMYLHKTDCKIEALTIKYMYNPRKLAIR